MGLPVAVRRGEGNAGFLAFIFRIFCHSHIVHLGAPDNKVVKGACRELWAPLFPLASAHQLLLQAACPDPPGDIFCSPSPALNARGLACAAQGHASRRGRSGPITGLSTGQPGLGRCPLTSCTTRTPFSSPLFSCRSFSIFALKPRPHTGGLPWLPGLSSSLVPPLPSPSATPVSGPAPHPCSSRRQARRGHHAVCRAHQQHEVPWGRSVSPQDRALQDHISGGLPWGPLPLAFPAGMDCGT